MLRHPSPAEEMFSIFVTAITEAAREIDEMPHDDCSSARFVARTSFHLDQEKIGVPPELENRLDEALEILRGRVLGKPTCSNPET